tara:strand:+ start:9 stop:671 length:663 start_codon:yes stop_codon:yes gene_type:complete
VSEKWSFSRLKSFEQCPKQFYHVKVAKEYEEPETEAMLYGSEFHKACEDYVRDRVSIPKKFAYIINTLDALIAKQGEKLCEYRMGVTKDLEPCSFFAENVWWRGIADLVILNGEEATVIDYKTGKSTRYADKGQLELMALATFKHFPVVKKVKAGLLFVVCNELIRDSYTADQQPDLWKKWINKYGVLEAAFKNNVWNPNPSGLCRRHCVVLECPHNGRS